jgi:hypothetical protein
MIGQLGQLIAVSTTASVSLGIIPMGPDRERLPVEDFYMFDDAEVAVELTSGYLRLTQPRDTGEYDRMFAELSKMAVYGTKARSLITSVIATLG